jgi:hypothetical protein
VGDRQRPGGSGSGYRPRLLLTRRRTRRDGKDRKTCYSACNSGASGGVANGDVAYDVCGMTRAGLVDIFEEMGLGHFYMTSCATVLRVVGGGVLGHTETSSSFRVPGRQVRWPWPAGL